MPWHQSMLGQHNQTNVTTCNDTEARTLYSLDYEFMKMGANMKNPSCMGKAFIVHIR